MAETASCPPSQADGSGSIAVAMYNIHNGPNGELESTLWAMEAMDVDIGVFLESKVTGRIYTQSSSVYSVIASDTPSTHQGGIALFWQPNKSYEVEDWQIRGPNLLLFTIVMGSQQFFAVGCYIPPNNLSSLQHIVQAWNECLRGHIPILLGDLNVNLRAPRKDRDEQIAEAVEDMMGLTNLSKHFCQRSRGFMGGRWTWRMRRGRRGISSQCDYLLGWCTDHRMFCSVCLQTPFNHNLDHCAIITRICVGSATKMAAYRKWMAKFPIKLPLGPQTELCSLFEEL